MSPKGSPVCLLGHGNYCNERCSSTEVYSFLRKAMRNVSADNPFRGPKEFVEGDYIYRDSNKGELGKFVGKETISFANEVVYSLHYSGGFIK
uniref:DUF5680 domain-containing protein n=1 Tax=Geobacillus sp. FSL W8-0026 TaxID=2954597 RepID=UPI00403F159F